MATLAGNTIASTYALLLKIDNTGIAGDGTLRKVEDGDATDSALSLSDVSIAVDATDKIFLDGGTHSYIHESASDVVQIVAGGTVVFEGDTNSRISLGNNDSSAVTSTTIFGYLAGQDIASGATYNTYFGSYAGSENTTGDYNTYIGAQAGLGVNGNANSYNTAVGMNALASVTTGGQNSILGQNAGDALTTGGMNCIIGQSACSVSNDVDNAVIIGVDAGNGALTDAADGTVAIGSSALNALTSGIGNVAVGYQSLDAAATSDYNTAVGHQTLSADAQDGTVANTAVGYNAGLVINGAKECTLIGAYSGDALTSGTKNTALGANSLSVATTALNCVALGFNAMSDFKAAVAVDGAIAIGYEALKGNASNSTDINGTVAIGKSALAALTTGAQNVAVGYTALDELITGNFNTAIGHETLASADGAESGNTAVGAQSLYYLDSDATNANTAVGTESGFYNVTGTNNTYLGYSAGKGATGQSNSNNTAVGKDSLLAITTGGDNTAVGNSALLAVAGGARNTAIGQDAGKAVVSGNDNTFLGEGSGLACTGTSNVTVGCEAGDEITSGSYNIAIGYRSSVGTVDGDKQYIIGNSLTGTAVDAIFIGDGDDHVRCDWGTDATWDKVSDERKKNVSGDSPLGLEFINDLRSVSFTYKAPCDYPKEWTSYNADKKEPRTKDEQHGILAQDVKKALDNAGVDTFAGWSEDPDGCQRIGESAFVMPLIKAVQELSAKVEELEAKLK